MKGGYFRKLDNLGLLKVKEKENSEERMEKLFKDLEE
jgi:hypothetical protein